MHVELLIKPSTLVVKGHVHTDVYSKLNQLENPVKNMDERAAAAKMNL